jgi:hypothetical protein
MSNKNEDFFEEFHRVINDTNNPKSADIKTFLELKKKEKVNIDLPSKETSPQ